MNEPLEKMEIYPGYLEGEETLGIVLVGEFYFLSIYVSKRQAASILTGLEGEQPGRPMTHDVFIEVINKLGGAVKRVVVDGIQGGVFMAKLYLEHGQNDEGIVLDIRPSDGMALAAREGCSIYVAREVLHQAGQNKETLGI
ncbi:MAG: bifunctional nuclease family protein [Thermoplasmatota archaeon]